jgi:hypothetical protein
MGETQDDWSVEMRAWVVAIVLLAVAFWAPAVGAASLPGDGDSGVQSGWSLDVAATNAQGGGAVRIDAQVAGGGGQRLCVTAVSDVVVGSFGCSVSGVGQRWFLDVSGQVRSQADPSRCWQVNSLSVSLDPCETDPSDAQTFVFGSDGTITTPAVVGRCLPAAVFHFAACTHPTSDAAFRFTIDAPPATLSLWQAPEVFFTSHAQRGYVSVENGVPSVEKSPQAENTGFYTTGVSGAPGTMYIRSYPSGMCLTEQGYSTASMKPCLAPGSDTSQRWYFDGSQIKLGTSDTPSDKCLRIGWPPPAPLYVSTCANQPWDSKFEWVASGAQLNTTLVGRSSSGAAVCMVPSTTDQTVSLGDCTQKTTAYRSMVDVLPDHTIRFQQTGNCLDDYADHPETAAQWTCHGAENQQWSFQRPTSLDTTRLPFPVQSPLNGWSSRILTPNTTSLGLRLDQAPSPTPYWTFQPTQAIVQCLAGVSQARVPRTPQGVGLSEYLRRLITRISALPGSGQYHDLSMQLANLASVQHDLAAGSSFQEQRQQLEQASLDAYIALQTYRQYVYQGRIQGVGVSVEWTAAFHVADGMLMSFDQAVVTSANDDELPVHLWSCQAPAPAAW